MGDSTINIIAVMGLTTLCAGIYHYAGLGPLLIAVGFSTLLYSYRLAHDKDKPKR